ncbi:lamin tail domain-containing protein [Chitinibacter bivalviorum]|uniref:Lamin tail domain-containing protein n=1 Tax=Chitinibacter bivalviorum TaxID=2739434 RepID=A0A7H9BKI2_9NEIS|nr:carbohydrate-binding protein [Chitinibacter bivalviorum]QLG89187.1 lamin tail domain-containing protein [Chitinibacter bivalviorum]
MKYQLNQAAFAILAAAAWHNSASAASCADAWQASKAYFAGSTVNYQGKDYRAKWWTQGEDPANNAIVGKPWELIGACSTSSTPIPTASIPPTIKPTNAPTAIPTPTVSPTPAATLAPSPTPTPKPTAIPTIAPTATPTAVPTAAPTTAPTLNPTSAPTSTPAASNSCNAEWVATNTYVAGNKVTRNGVNYQAKWWTQGNDPVSNSGDAQPWQNMGPCGNTATPTLTPTPAVTPIASASSSATPSTSITPSPQPSSTPTGNGIDHLLINEVAADPSGQGSWFEIYNPTNQTITLNDVSARIQSKQLGSASSYALSGTINAKSYVVVSTNTDAVAPKKNTQLQYIGNAQDWPVWSNDNGAIELVRNGQTVDFVRFGNSNSQPLSAMAWQGSNAPALTGNASYSLVRYFTQTVDSDSAADWRVVPFGTPAGQNDIDSNATDSDHDGIPTSAKQPGGTYAGMDLYAMGARAARPTILIHIDWMQTNTDEGIKPRKEALQLVREAFNRKGIDVLFDAGQLHNPNFSPADFNLGNGKEVPFARCVTLYKNADCADVMAYKNDSMDVRRRLIFHYMLMGSTQNTNGYGGSSGLAEINGNDLLISLGFWGLNSSSGTELYKLINYQAGTIMHELGHNLGLYHGGNEGTNNKPNYLSVMNYDYQLNGVPSDPAGQSMSERIYYRQNNLGRATPSKAANSYGVCDLLDGPCGNRFVIDYSNGSSMALNEWGLDESRLIGRGANNGAFADWNVNGKVEQSVAFDSNGDGITQTALSDYDDWGHIQLAFNVGSISALGLRTAAEPITPNSKHSRKLHDERKEVAAESPPPAHMLKKHSAAN